MRPRVLFRNFHPGRLTRWIAPALITTALGCREEAGHPPLRIPGAGVFPGSGGTEHTCGVTTDDRVYCWGFGLLGNGSTYSQRLAPVAVAGTLRFRQVRQAGRRHHHRSPEAGSGLWRAPLPAGERGRIPQLRRHHV